MPPAIAPITKETNAVYTAARAPLGGRPFDRGPHYTEADLWRSLPRPERTQTASESAAPNPSA